MSECFSSYRQPDAPLWAAPGAPPVPQVWRAGLGRRSRAGSARTCSFPHLGAPPRRVAAACRQALQSAAEVRRGRGAASAAGHHGAARVEALPMQAAFVVDALAVGLQLWCAETGRPARGRRPASLSMAIHAAARARSDRLRCWGRRLRSVDRGAGCMCGGRRRGQGGGLCKVSGSPGTSRREVRGRQGPRCGRRVYI